MVADSVGGGKSGDCYCGLHNFTLADKYTVRQRYDRRRSTVICQSGWQAANNSKEQFANSPDLTSEILLAVMDSMDAQTELGTRAINSEEIRKGLKLILLDRLGLYEKLRTRASSR